jgi:phosphohistidine phosphatase
MTIRRLILMRHANAGPSGGASGDGDRARPLTRRGLLEAQHVGERLQERGLVPDRVLCSVARRCRETWQEVSRAFDDEIAVDFAERLYDASERVLLEAIAEVDLADTLLVLAHNPGISLLARELGGDSGAAIEDLRRGFTPATTACFEVAGPWSALSRRTARLLHLEGPSEPS